MESIQHDQNDPVASNKVVVGIRVRLKLTGCFQVQLLHESMAHSNRHLQQLRLCGAVLAEQIVRTAMISFKDCQDQTL
jgi:hypothetical protein